MIKQGPGGIGTKRLDWLDEVDDSYSPMRIRKDAMSVQQVLVECSRAIIEEMRIEFWKLKNNHQ